MATKYPGACRTERRDAISGSLLNKSEMHYEMDRLARQLSDSDADGTWDSEETFKYDENDRLSTQERDSDRDGALDVILRYEYSGSSSNWLRTVRDVPEPSWMDLGDGDQVTTATYNARDLLTETVVEDCPCDGPPIDEVRRQVRSYDAADQLILLTTIRSSDQETTREERYFYSEAGRLIRTELDLSGTDGPFPDGVPETINTHHYEDGVNISRRDVDTDADGNVDDQVFYFYDCHDE